MLIYTAWGGGGPSPRYYWPFKLEHVGTAKKGTRETCDVYMMDSGISNDDITNEEVLDAAETYGADYVIPKDYLNDQNKTTESVNEFLDIYESHTCEADYLIPLQPPHDKHFEDFEGHGTFALGGIAKKPASAQLDYIRKFREVAGDDVYVHVLGLGASRELVDAFRNDPGLVDSIDTSTPVNAPKNGEIPDATFIQNRQKFQIPGGDGTSTGHAIVCEFILWEMAQMLNPDWSGSVDRKQSGITDF